MKIRIRVVPRAWAASVALAMLVAGVGVAPAVARPGRLDGQVFEIPALDDELTFANGCLNTVRSAALGYQKASYVAAPWAGGIGFRARLANADGRRREWRGLIKGKAMEGEVSTTARGRTTTLSFTATLKPVGASPS